MISLRLQLMNAPFLLFLTIFLNVITTQEIIASQSNWSMGNYDVEGTRNNIKEKKFNRSNVSQLSIKWSFPTTSYISASPIVENSIIYVGDESGNFYAIKDNGNHGSLVWKTQLGVAAIYASAYVKGNKVIVGDAKGKIYYINKNTGAVLKSIQPSNTSYSAIWSGVIRVGNKIIVATNSDDEGPFGMPDPCCEGRGSVTALDPENANVLWQTYTITGPVVTNDGEPSYFSKGPSGAAIWNTAPTYSSKTGYIYVSTSQNYSPPATNTSDAVLAFDAKTGDLKEVFQGQSGDIFNFANQIFDPSNPKDMDIPTSPKVYDLKNGKQVVAACSKKGVFYVLDSKTLAPVNGLNGYAIIPVPGAKGDGGCNLDMALEKVNGSNVIFAFANDYSGYYALHPAPFPIFEGPTAADGVGHVVAMKDDGSSEKCRLSKPGEDIAGGMATANGVLFFRTGNTGTVYAMNTNNCQELAAVPLGVSQFGAHLVVANGKVYTGSGANLGIFPVQFKGLFALGI